jgi:hypothetical protein
LINDAATDTKSTTTAADKRGLALSVAILVLSIPALIGA